ncbi:hypothetical protein LSAT2_023904 [Lamellibrachia satsuma]|nr:hypothetical protein LSAT2_023904 [Lamellibrachia satsuma]
MASPHVDMRRLRHRGPDSCHMLTCDLSSDVRATFYGCTLHFQGAFTVQPISDDQSNVLLWNGEIFGGIERRDAFEALMSYP